MVKIFSTFLFLFFLSAVSFAQSSAQIAYGPVVTAYLLNLTEEFNELEFQLQHQEISRADYTRSKQRLVLQKQFVEKHTAETGEDAIPELQILTLDEIVTMLGVNAAKTQTLNVGDVLAGKWQINGIEKRGERFYILARKPKEISADMRPKINPLDVIETITVYEPDAEELRAKQPVNVNAVAPPPTPRAVEIPRPQIRALYLPTYTSKAREKNIEGKVILSALFTRDGNLKDLKVEQKLGYGLDESAMTAAKKLLFEPAKVNGQPIDLRAHIVYTFTLTHTIATIQPLAREENH